MKILSMTSFIRYFFGSKNEKMEMKKVGGTNSDAKMKPDDEAVVANRSNFLSVEMTVFMLES